MAGPRRSKFSHNKTMETIFVTQRIVNGNWVDYLTFELDDSLEIVQLETDLCSHVGPRRIVKRTITFTDEVIQVNS